MKREEAIHILDNLKPTNTKSSFDAYIVGNAITMAIKALEQEPILDKISAEIENDWQLKEYPSSPFSCGLRLAIEIIDKYKSESEVTDAGNN